MVSDASHGAVSLPPNSIEIENARQADAAMSIPCSSWSVGDRPMLTIAEAASFLHVSQSWVRRHLSELPYTFGGGD